MLTRRGRRGRCGDREFFPQEILLALELLYELGRGLDGEKRGRGVAELMVVKRSRPGRLRRARPRINIRPVFGINTVPTHG